jgi:putative CocE/NonD family hydrolase
MRLRGTSLLIVACSIGFQGTGRGAPVSAPPEQAAPAAVRRLAEALIASYAWKERDEDLLTLFQLQFAAGRYADAEATLDRLVALRRQTDMKAAWRLLPWQVYVRGERRAAQEGIERDKAFEDAFRKLYGSLDDKTAVGILPWFTANLDAARRELAEATKTCPEPIEACPGATRLVRATVFLQAWSFLMPAAEPLLKAEMRRRFVVEDQLLIPTPDGAKIAALIVRPRGAQRVTSLMNFTIYTYDGNFADAAKMAANGYAGVVAYTRGKAWSPGDAVPYVHDGADAATVIDWIARQSWSDGRVGMFSGSYNASTQWAAVKHRPKALKAIATHASNAPGIDTPMERNIFENFFYPWPLYTTTVKGLNDTLYYDPARWSALNRNWYVSGRPYRDLDKIDGTPNPIFDTWLKHPSYDAYWQRLLPYREEFAKVNIPVFVETGYFDGGMVGALYYLRQHYRYDPKAEHRLLIGPYHHTAMGQGVLTNFAGYEIDQAARLDLQDIRLKWFDHVFRGAPLPELLSDRVNFEVMGANLWRHVPSLDAMGNGRMRLYLSDAREGERRALTEARPVRRGATEIQVDFKDRSDVDYQPPSQLVSRELDARNALVLATPPFGAPFEVNGSFVGKLNIVANKRDLDLAVSLYEQLPDGRYFPLAYFIGRASYLADRSRRHLLRLGRTRTLDFESDRMTSRRIGAGSRIVAVVGVLKQPDFQINYGTGKDVSDESIADAGEPLRLRWSNDSYIELKVWRCGFPRSGSFAERSGAFVASR